MHVCMEIMCVYARNISNSVMCADLEQPNTKAGWPAGWGLVKSILRFLLQLACLSLLSFVTAC